MAFWVLHKQFTFKDKSLALEFRVLVGIGYREVGDTQRKNSVASVDSFMVPSCDNSDQVPLGSNVTNFKYKK